MKVKVISLTEEVIEERDYRDAVAIEIDGKKVFEVRDDEPEDSNLSRSFSDVWKIPELMEMAFIAGSKHEDLEIISEEVEEI
ncbi:hypothetical protein [uncultured Clostridium sp.]|uniref:hypothetical protein n=1 Tax=uncultured Clostridium sp. TaxID=59620 RepID=UPI0028EC6E55|nr:hypothetical protein [uncultured Clostridium sp.]